MAETTAGVANGGGAGGTAPIFRGQDGLQVPNGHVEALIGVDFEILPNEVVGLLGDNGAGKSTLIKIMSGVVRPDTGSFFRNGTPIILNSRRQSEAAGIETIYQDIALVGSMSIMRNVFAGRELTNRGRLPADEEDARYGDADPRPFTCASPASLRPS